LFTPTFFVGHGAGRAGRRQHTVSPATVPTQVAPPMLTPTMFVAS